MNYKIWSKQCDSCYGTHKDIVVSVSTPTDPIGCPFCGGMMYTYELGKGFKPMPNTLRYDTDLLIPEVLAAA